MSEETPVIEECDCCGFEFPFGELREYNTASSRRFNKETGKHDLAYYCDLCASSRASTYWDYQREEHDITSVICYVGNAILKAIRTGN